MPHSLLWFVVLNALTLSLGSGTPGVKLYQARNAAVQSRTLLAVFAHPDDEILVAPLLSSYDRDLRA